MRVMSTATAVKATDPCPACMEVFDDDAHVAMPLPCGHSICADCMDTLPLRNGKCLCPRCMIMEQVPEAEHHTHSPKDDDMIDRLSFKS